MCPLDQAGRWPDWTLDDWGFWHEALHNFETTRQLLPGFEQSGRIDADQFARVRDRLAVFEQRLHAAPKSRRWVKRSRAGFAKPWFREVEEIVR